MSCDLLVKKILEICLILSFEKACEEMFETKEKAGNNPFVEEKMLLINLIKFKNLRVTHGCEINHVWKELARI